MKPSRQRKPRGSGRGTKEAASYDELPKDPVGPSEGVEPSIPRDWTLYTPCYTRVRIRRAMEIDGKDCFCESKPGDARTGRLRPRPPDVF